MRAVAEFLTIRHNQFIDGKTISRFLRSKGIFIDTQWGGYRRDPEYQEFMSDRVKILLRQEKRRDAEAEEIG